MFRSSLTTAISGIGAGIVASVQNSTPLESALAALITALAVAVTDHFARKKLNRAHDEKFLNQHAITRAEFWKAQRRRKRRKTQTEERK